MWLFKLFFWLNFFGQIEHENGFSPVWVLKVEINWGKLAPEFTARIHKCFSNLPHVTDKIIFLYPPFATILALVWFIEHMYPYMLFIVLRSLKGSITETAFVGVAKDVRFNVCRQICTWRKTFITDTTFKAFLLLTDFLVLLSYVLWVVVLVEERSIAVRT